MLALVAGLGLRSPSPPDEPRFVLAAHAMVESGQWLIPHRGLEIYAEKPPVFMWMQAVSYTVVRNWQVAFLLPRSEERRVGKECVRTGRSRWAADHEKKNKIP